MTAHLKSLCFYASDLIIYIHPGWRNPKSGNWNKKNSWGSFQPWQFQDTQSSDHHNLSQIIIIDDPWSLIITGWWFQPLSKIWKSVGVIIPNIWKIKKKCSKPPIDHHKLFADQHSSGTLWSQLCAPAKTSFEVAEAWLAIKSCPPGWDGGKTCPNLRGTWKMSFSTGMAG